MTATAPTPASAEPSEPASRNRRSLRRVGGLTAAIFGLLSLVTPSTAFSVDDTTPPELVDFSISPVSVDTSGGSASITLTARLTDDLSGARSFSVVFQSPSGQSVATGLGRIAGTALDGTYQGTLIIPQFAEQATWTVRSRE